MENIKDKHVVIVGAGASVSNYKNDILKHISQNNALTIGINFMTSLCIPDYHLWTNKKRYISQHSCINKKSKLLFGSGISDSLIKKYWHGDYIRVNYISKESKPISYIDGVIYGYYRTAGVLAVMLAHIKKARKIDIVGMDGYTFYSKKSLKNKKESHHCYGKGYTDYANWDKCLLKDKQVDDNLHKLKQYGVEFSIITPTKFIDFYGQTILGVLDE